MNQPDEPSERRGGVPPTPPSPASLRDQLLPAVSSVILLTVVTGAIFPLALWALGHVFFQRQANGSLLTVDGSVRGSELIGQDFTRPEYFHPRPSAAGAGYDASSSGGANLGLNNPKLTNGAADGSFAGIRRLAEEYREQNELSAQTAVPIDAVTRSGSGLDPHISPENAALQVPRIARARGLTEEAVRKLVAEYTYGPQLGLLGSERVSVLGLNLALDQTRAGKQPR